MHQPTPLVPATVAEVYDRCGGASALREFVVGEMRSAAVKRRGDVVAYGECFGKCEGLREVVLEQGIAGGILAAWARMAEEAWDGEDDEDGDARERWWWRLTRRGRLVGGKGPF